jgi:NADPH:quinone reductase-like Zn-dependent oxidoreductase
LQSVSLPELKDGQICIQMLAAPINPADINMVNTKKKYFAKNRKKHQIY